MEVQLIAYVLFNWKSDFYNCRSPAFTNQGSKIQLAPAPQTSALHEIKYSYYVQSLFSTEWDLEFYTATNDSLHPHAPVF